MGMETVSGVALTLAGIALLLFVAGKLYNGLLRIYIYKRTGLSSKVGVPYVGVLFEFMNNFVYGLFEDNQEIFVTVFFGSNYINMTGEVSRGLGKIEKKLSSGFEDTFKTMVGRTSIAIVEGRLHTRLHATCVKALSPSVWGKLVPQMNEKISILLERWYQTPIDELDLHTELTRLPVALIAQGIVGPRIAEHPRIKDYTLFKEYMDGLYCLIKVGIPGTTWAKSVRARKELEEMFREEIKIRRKIPEDQKAKDTLDSLVTIKDENGIPLEDEEITQTLLFLMFAAQDTTAALMGSAIWCAGQYPDIVDRLRKEIRTVTGWQADSGSSVEKVTREQLDEMNLLHAFVQEVHRLYPPVSSITRVAKEDIDWHGYTIPKGWGISKIPAVAARRKKYFEDPFKFQPMRFLPPRLEQTKLAKGVWTPFGIGVRMCPGDTLAYGEVKLLLVNIIHRYDLESPTFETGFMPTTNIPVSHPAPGALKVKLIPTTS